MSNTKSKQVYHSQARTIVASVIEYFYLEKDNMGPLKDVKKVLERVSEACGVPIATVKRINIERKNISNVNEDVQTEQPICEEDIDVGVEDQDSSAADTSSKKRKTVITTPRKKKLQVRERPVTALDDFGKSALRRHIIGYYERKEVPTLNKMMDSLKEAGLFHGGKTSLIKIIKDLGFSYKKFNNRKVLMEKPSVALKRCQFLRKAHDIDLSKTVFLDETWINQNTSVDKGWTDDSVKGTLGTPLGKGKRLIICHAGGESGWINAPPLIFQSKKTNDYHEEMNHQVFENWFFNTLIPVLPAGSVIIMDNASYHSRVKDKCPSTNSKKSEMASWLQQRGVCFPNDLRKPELYNLVLMHKPPHPTYVIDDKAAELGHKIIRLPPYHCQYNAIEMVWAYIKSYVKERNHTFKMKDVETLFAEGVAAVTPELWSKYANHAKKIMNEEWKNEGLDEQSVKDFVINLCPGDFDSDTGSESGSEDDLECSYLL
jgi:transposase